VYVLTTLQDDGETRMACSLRTRVANEAMEDDLSKMLGRRRPDGSAVIRFEQLVDGVPMFEDAADAECFADFLQADTSSQVSLAQVDAHSMFRELQGAKSVAVVFRRGSYTPMPDQLAVSLRGQRSLEEI
jgi:ribosome-binding factor A